MWSPIKSQWVSSRQFSIWRYVVESTANDASLAKSLHDCILTGLTIMCHSLYSILCLIYQLCWGNISIIAAHKLWLNSYNKILKLLSKNCIKISCTTQYSCQTKIYFLLLLQITMMILSCQLIKRCLRHAHTHHCLLLICFLFRWHIELMLYLKVWWYCCAEGESKTIQLMHSRYAHSYVLNPVKQRWVLRYIISAWRIHLKLFLNINIILKIIICHTLFRFLTKGLFWKLLE